MKIIIDLETHFYDLDKLKGQLRADGLSAEQLHRMLEQWQRFIEFVPLRPGALAGVWRLVSEGWDVHWRTTLTTDELRWAADRMPGVLSQRSRFHQLTVQDVRFLDFGTWVVPEEVAVHVPDGQRAVTFGDGVDGWRDLMRVLLPEPSAESVRAEKVRAAVKDDAGG